MDKEVISHGEARTILILYIMGSTMILGAAGEAKTDSWISILLAMAIAVPIYWAWARVLTLYPGQNMFDIALHVLGKWIGKAFILIYIWYAFHLGALVLRNFGEFMEAEAMPETPMLVPMLFVTALGIGVVRAGIETMGRSGRMLLNMCLVTMLLVFLLVLGKLHYSNLLPILDRGWPRVWKGAFSAFSFPFAEAVIFLGAISSIKGKKNLTGIFLYSLLIGGALILFITLRNIMVLGVYTIDNVYFPSYAAVGRINVGNFIQRIEGSVSIVFVICVFMKLSVCLMAASKGIAKLFSLDSYRSVVIQTGLLTAYLAYLLYDNIMEMQYWTTYIYSIYAVPFEILLPLSLLLFAEIKTRRDQRSKPQPD
ncbi:GerAB/ArcD/ProY family transporter [Paenibacillus sanguinis]|uniref:GerAB/ArcD/ProY family transporter n=1 Tax=Paenibacillus sanguinis TaxID=225906 RepID=UPI0003685DB9|nr:endospore germination permease [Paenibacillus sanguinis]